MKFAAKYRSEHIETIKKTCFDVVVIGGGITGAGIALDAAARGMQVLLVEKNDFASGTSSKSTKLIHGGLRYLKQLEFRLVQTVGLERAVIHKLAPHLVTPVNMLLPIYKNGSLGRVTTSLALRVYDMLAKVQKSDAYKMLGRKEAHQTEPLLDTHNLLGAALYKEYRTDDARLTIAILKTASAHGALCLNYMQAVKCFPAHGTAEGVLLTDTISGQELHVKALQIINATGPWQTRLEDATRRIEKSIFLSKGIHIVLKYERFPVSNAMYFDVSGDKRMIFVIPRDDKVYIGTTDTAYTGNVENITTLMADVKYLLHAANAKFPGVNLQTNDVISSWAGLRPLILQRGKSAAEISRKDEIFVSADGVITIAGGKLTGYRKMAEKAVDIASKKIFQQTGKRFQNCQTKTIQLHGADIPYPLTEYNIRLFGFSRQVNFSQKTINRWVSLYGSATESILDIAYEQARQCIKPEELAIAAEAIYCIQHENVYTLSDFIIRRAGMLYFQPEEIPAAMPVIKKVFHEWLQLTASEISKQEEIFNAEWTAATSNFAA